MLRGEKRRWMVGRVGDDVLMVPREEERCDVIGWIHGMALEKRKEGIAESKKDSEALK